MERNERSRWPECAVGRLVRFYLHALALGSIHALVPAFAADPAPDGLRVLVLTTSRQRVENIRRVWGGRPSPSDGVKRLLWLTTLDLLYAGDLLSGPWVSLDSTDTEQRRLVAGPEEG